jgi:hypothetical protein
VKSFYALNVDPGDARVIVGSRIGTGQSILGDTAWGILIN